MLHKAWNSKEEMPYIFPRSSIKFQGHTVQNITDFDPNWAFPDYRPVAAFKSLRFALFQHTIVVCVLSDYFVNICTIWCYPHRMGHRQHTNLKMDLVIISKCYCIICIIYIYSLVTLYSVLLISPSYSPPSNSQKPSIASREGQVWASFEFEVQSK